MAHVHLYQQIFAEPLACQANEFRIGLQMPLQRCPDLRAVQCRKLLWSVLFSI